jgi:hypothetical protein
MNLLCWQLFKLRPYYFFCRFKGHQLCAIKIKGSAFLLHQVCCMVAVLLMIGQGLESPDVSISCHCNCMVLVLYLIPLIQKMIFYVDRFNSLHYFTFALAECPQMTRILYLNKMSTHKRDHLHCFAVALNNLLWFMRVNAYICMCTHVVFNSLFRFTNNISPPCIAILSQMIAFYYNFRRGPFRSNIQHMLVYSKAWGILCLS